MTTTDAGFGDVTATLGDGHVAEVELHRPPANYFDATLLSAVVDAVAWSADHGARAVVLCSEGRHFCAGLDFGSTEQPGPDALATLYGTGASDPTSCQFNGVQSWIDKINPDATMAHGVLLAVRVCSR